MSLLKKYFHLKKTELGNIFSKYSEDTRQPFFVRHRLIKIVYILTVYVQNIVRKANS